jgi:hypothetical protein
VIAGRDKRARNSGRGAVASPVGHRRSQALMPGRLARGPALFCGVAALPV